MPDYPPNVKVIAQPVTPEGNDAADWQDNPEAVETFKASIEAATQPLNADDLIGKLLGGLTVSEADAEKFCDPDWVYENLIIEGHITVIAAQPNGGKTTLLWNLSPVMVQRGYQVTYINSDISGSDAKSLIPQSRDWGIELLLPDMGQALGMGYVVSALQEMAQAGVRFDKRVFIFDTLKKMTPPNDKGATRELFKTLRALSAQGMTLVLLAHTLKYPGDDGLPVFEGVGDIKSDADNLLYLIPADDPGGKIISTYPDKVRGQFERVSFRINADRTVTPLRAHIDLKARKAAEAAYESDREEIEEIHEALRQGALVQSDVVKAVSMGRNKALKLLRRYRGKQWREDTKDNNSKWYQSLPPAQRHPENLNNPMPPQTTGQPKQPGEPEAENWGYKA